MRVLGFSFMAAVTNHPTLLPSGAKALNTYQVVGDKVPHR